VNVPVTVVRQQRSGGFHALRASRPALARPERRASESNGLGAVAAARAARRAALTMVTETIYRKQLRPVIEGSAEVMDLIFPTRIGEKLE
jgi:hypothetical protein